MSGRIVFEGQTCFCLIALPHTRPIIIVPRISLRVGVARTLALLASGHPNVSNEFLRQRRRVASDNDDDTHLCKNLSFHILTFKTHLKVVVRCSDAIRVKLSRYNKTLKMSSIFFAWIVWYNKTFNATQMVPKFSLDLVYKHFPFAVC